MFTASAGYGKHLTWPPLSPALEGESARLFGNLATVGQLLLRLDCQSW